MSVEMERRAKAAELAVKMLEKWISRNCRSNPHYIGGVLAEAERRIAQSESGNGWVEPFEGDRSY